MKMKTVYFPPTMVDVISQMVKNGLFPNYSEAIRSLVASAIASNKQLLSNLNDGEELQAEYKKTNIVSVKFPYELIYLLDKAAKMLGLSRSEFIRMAVLKTASQILFPDVSDE